MNKYRRRYRNGMKQHEIVNLDNGVMYKVDELEIEYLLRNRVIYYHHNLNMYCYKKKKK